jgi:hypothetical protein
MQAKDYLTLMLSVSALLVSLYNLYAQQFRRRDRIVGSALSISLNEGLFNRKSEYFLSNVGDTQLVLKEVNLMDVKSHEGEARILNIETSSKLPCVIKPGEVLLIDIFFHSVDYLSADRLDAQFVLISNRGVIYWLPHSWKGVGSCGDPFSKLRITKNAFEL